MIIPSLCSYFILLWNLYHTWLQFGCIKVLEKQIIKNDVVRMVGERLECLNVKLKLVSDGKTFVSNSRLGAGTCYSYSAYLSSCCLVV